MGAYFIQKDKPGYLLGYKNKPNWVWAYNIQELFEFDIDEVKFNYDKYVIDDTDIVIAEFSSFDTCKEELGEYLV